eukprot:scaffold195918_cov26-Tisochrysis_lutea.AAC.2
MRKVVATAEVTRHRAAWKRVCRSRLSQSRAKQVGSHLVPPRCGRERHPDAVRRLARAGDDVESEKRSSSSQ